MFLNRGFAYSINGWFFKERDVDFITNLPKRQCDTQIQTEKIMIQRQIDATKQQIDQLVYGLYGLNKKAPSGNYNERHLKHISFQSIILVPNTFFGGGPVFQYITNSMT